VGGKLDPCGDFSKKEEPTTNDSFAFALFFCTQMKNEKCKMQNIQKRTETRPKQAVWFINFQFSFCTTLLALEKSEEHPTHPTPNF